MLMLRCNNSPDACSVRPDFGPPPIQHMDVLDYGDNLVDPINMILIMVFFFVLSIFMLHWVISSKSLPAHGRARTSSEVGVDVGCCRFVSWRMSIKLIITTVCLLIAVAAISTAFVTLRKPKDHDGDGKVDIADSYVQPWLIAIIASLGGIAVLVLLISCGLFTEREDFRYDRARRDSLNRDEAPEEVVHKFDPLDPNNPEQEVPDDRGLESFSAAQRFFRGVAKVAARYPWTVLLCSFVFVGLCGIGIMNVYIESDPVKLWVPPDSEIIGQKNEFDRDFAKFYRVEQLIVTSTTSLNILEAANLLAVLQLQTDLAAMPVLYTYPNGSRSLNITLDLLCFRPIPGKGCLVESVTEYWVQAPNYGGPTLDLTQSLSDIKQWLGSCSHDVTNSACRGTIGVPTFPYVVLGGYGGDTYINATALVITFLLNNNDETEDMAKVWEQAFLNKAAKGLPGLNVVYSSERSIADELSRGSESDIVTIAISYSLMFFYISLALGRIKFDRMFCVRTKFLLGLASIIIVLCSLVVSLGICASLGIHMTPIISEVIPFLVLAIGIDNVFMILNNFEAQAQGLSIEERLAGSLSEVGVSITLASMSEALAFLLGGLTKMPAVQAFAFYSAAAIAADYLLQITAFCAVLVLDARRTEEGRADCMPCVRVVDPMSLQGGGALVHPLRDESDGQATGAPAGKLYVEEGCLKMCLRKYYTTFLLKPVVKAFVVCHITALPSAACSCFISLHAFCFDNSWSFSPV
jgi:hypothetical protein